MARRRYQPRSPRFDPRAMSTEKSGGRELLIADVDFVGELVDIVLGARKVFRQMPACFADGLDDSVGELAVLETGSQARCDVIPEPRRHLLVDAAVAEDGEPLLFGSDEQQYAVAQLRARHAQALEGALGGFANVIAPLGLDVDADFARRLFLGAADGVDDARLIEL